MLSKKQTKISWEIILSVMIDVELENEKRVKLMETSI